MARVLEADPEEVEATPKKVIRDKAFAKRLLTACESQPDCPDVGRGQQKWVYDSLRDRYAIKVSPEAVSKWFAGETRPRPKIMSMLARLLEVDEAWLSLGIKPDVTPDQKRVRSAVTNGVTNLLAGLIQLAGGHVAYPDAEGGPDMFVIMGGKPYEVDVRIPVETTRGLQFSFDHRADAKPNLVLLGVVLGDSMRDFTILRFTTEIIESEGDLRGDFSEITVQPTQSGFFAGRVRIPELDDMRVIGESPRVRVRVSAGH